MNLSEERIDYLIRLGKYLEYHKVEREAQRHKLSIDKATKSIGIDPGFGSSNFAIVATQLVDGKIQIIHAEEHERDEAGFIDMIDEVWNLKQRCGHVDNIYVSITYT